MMEEVSGGRMHYMFNRVGGLKEDLPGGLAGPRPARRRRRALADGRLRRPGARQRDLPRPHPRGRASSTPEAVHAYGVSGPIARASGVDFDLRRDEPYLAYGELQDTLKVVTRERGRLPGPLRVLLEQAHNSLDLADACLDRLAELPPGPINQRLPKVLKAPEGHTYAWTENPLGINGYYLVSKGEKTPYRLKLRSASFNNIQALTELLPGHAGRRHGGDPGVDLLRRRRHRQVARAARASGDRTAQPRRHRSAPSRRARSGR